MKQWTVAVEYFGPHSYPVADPGVAFSRWTEKGWKVEKVIVVDHVETDAKDLLVRLVGLLSRPA